MMKKFAMTAAVLMFTASAMAASSGAGHSMGGRAEPGKNDSTGSRDRDAVGTRSGSMSDMTRRMSQGDMRLEIGKLIINNARAGKMTEQTAGKLDEINRDPSAFGINDRSSFDRFNMDVEQYGMTAALDRLSQRTGQRITEEDVAGCGN
jgi:hypothetical protein